MHQHKVKFTAKAQRQIGALFHYIATAGSPKIAEHFTNAILMHCETLQNFPYRGTQRDDIRPGLRITHYKRRTTIAFAVEKEQVTILGIFYGGQDFQSVLKVDPQNK